MGIKLTRMLKETDIEDTSRFYADSAKYVPYFQKMFGVTDCTEELYKNFRPDITAAIRSGGCMGMFEDGVMIGANAVVIEGVHVGKNAVVAAGAVVIEDVPENAVVAGCPARVVKMKDEGTTQKTALEAALRNL